MSTICFESKHTETMSYASWGDFASRILSQILRSLLYFLFPKTLQLWLSLTTPECDHPMCSAKSILNRSFPSTLKVKIHCNQVTMGQVSNPKLLPDYKKTQPPGEGWENCLTRWSVSHYDSCQEENFQTTQLLLCEAQLSDLITARPCVEAPPRGECLHTVLYEIWQMDKQQ